MRSGLEYSGAGRGGGGGVSLGALYTLSLGALCSGSLSLVLIGRDSSTGGRGALYSGLELTLLPSEFESLLSLFEEPLVGLLEPDEG